jgi:serine/threonine protein kinase
VAIKQMLPHALDSARPSSAGRYPFALNHAHLPHVTDHFQEETGLFMAMQFIPGLNLGQLLASRELPFPPHQVKKWAEDLLATIDYLHSREPRIIHRDIKPNNLKLAPDGKLILLDFGLAREISQSESHNPTQDICILAYTPHYAPPEQIQGLHTDRFSDIYALGISLPPAHRCTPIDC